MLPAVPAVCAARRSPRESAPRSRRRQPRPLADVDLAQRGVDDDREAEARADDLRRLARPREVAGRPRRSAPGEPTRASSRACARPVSFSGGSAWPCQRRSRFQSVSPCRARRSVVTPANVAARGPRTRGQGLRRHRLDRRASGSHGREQLAGRGREGRHARAAARDGLGDLHVAADLAEPGEPERLVAAALGGLRARRLPRQQRRLGRDPTLRRADRRRLGAARGS